MRKRLLLSLASLGVVAGCHTVVEDLPTKPPLQSSLVIHPTGGTTGASPTASPTPTPAPGPTPTPQPQPTPAAGSTLPVARVTVKVNFVVCDNEGVPNSDGLTNIPVGCKVHLDVNFKDANNKPTDPESDIEWSYSNESMIDLHEDPDGYTPYFEVLSRGRLLVTAEADGVKSSPLELYFY
jgi:hypothetical protein